MTNDLQELAGQQLTDPPKPKRKYRRRKPARAPRAAAAAKPSPPSADGEFAGLTPMNCCDDCNPAKCVITGHFVCGHPHKGGLQAADMMKPETLQRFNRAKKYLAQQAVDRKHRDT